MVLSRSLEFKGVIVQIVCVVEIQFESAWAVTIITSETTCHAYWSPNLMYLSQVVLKKKIFRDLPMYFDGSNPGPLGRIHFESWGHYLNKLG